MVVKKILKAFKYDQRQKKVKKDKKNFYFSQSLS